MLHPTRVVQPFPLHTRPCRETRCSGSAGAGDTRHSRGDPGAEWSRGGLGIPELCWADTGIRSGLKHFCRLPKLRGAGIPALTGYGALVPAGKLQLALLSEPPDRSWFSQEIAAPCCTRAESLPRAQLRLCHLKEQLRIPPTVLTFISAHWTMRTSRKDQLNLKVEDGTLEGSLRLTSSFCLPPSPTRQIASSLTPCTRTPCPLPMPPAGCSDAQSPWVWGSTPSPAPALQCAA